MQKRLSGKSFVVVGACALVVLLGGAYLGFRSLGRERFERGSLMTEAHLHVALLARGIAACAEAPVDGGAPRRKLPATTPPVPESIAALRGGYKSAASDWDSDAFRCAKFAVSTPQQFQYRWELTGSDRGLAEASGDLDGDGRAEVFLHVSVSCRDDASGFKCEIGSVEASEWSKDAAAPR